MKKLIKKLNLFLLITILFTSLFTATYDKVANAYSQNIESTLTSVAINDFQGVADYIHKYGKLPSNFITKAKAQSLGWRPGEDLWDYAYGMSIGGDIFTNSEKILPTAKKRVWHECDINYNGGHRGADRIVYSNDGLIYGTTNHYQTFTQYY
ncbi:ribonuclease [Clostridium sp. SHJSY1]|uniref:ribonuclease n=1 Tax=Clostridium sp. SHJSY1 TaxID=2942483 RepID=UPI00287643FF|nr:ribonuclease domain-containing protein [Clostridium sp. SHJSY1]MDS0524722.1 ribonuclease [Clostridium sp. SHJSY1]